ncbi:MAG TPA: class I SAM-dependent methyltransferase [Anaerolineales bacterium]|nr:class I SAM-dependent methyltransferase [Anaerolineales bacterium]
MDELQYGNWIRRKVLWLLASIGSVSALLAALPLPLFVRLVAGLFGIVSIISLLYPLYLYRSFSRKGGNLQDKFYDSILDHLENHGFGKVLDIGTGNGILAIKAAVRNRAAEVTGVDYWGKEWEYSKATCEENARLAGVQEIVCFRKGDAASLNFGDGAFDAVVSNLTFHEVKMVKNKTDVVREALRVLKPGGSFAFIDYFYDEGYYGETSRFQLLLWSLKLAEVKLEPLGDVVDFPKLLHHPRALGKVGIVYGRK